MRGDGPLQRTILPRNSLLAAETAAEEVVAVMVVKTTDALVVEAGVTEELKIIVGDY